MKPVSARWLPNGKKHYTPQYMNQYPPAVKKEIKAYQKLRKTQLKEQIKLQEAETKLAKELEALTEKHTQARIAVMRAQKSHTAQQSTPITRLVLLCQKHSLMMSSVLADANQLDLNKINRAVESAEPTAPQSADL